MPLSFLCANILKHLCSIVTSSMLRQWYANLEGQRSHECERGTNECVRHTDIPLVGSEGRFAPELFGTAQPKPQGRSHNGEQCG
jgi:hypothetical protein